MAKTIQHPPNDDSSRFLHITKIQVSKLFGEYSYNLDASLHPSDSRSRVCILYGDNGSGKTTLLQMVFHLLHPAPKGGHRTFLGQRLFKKFEVRLGSHVSVGADRAEGYSGPFRTWINIDGRQSEALFTVDTDGKAHVASKDEAEVQPFFESLGSLKISLYFLRDDRTILTTAGFWEMSSTNRVLRRQREPVRYHASTDALPTEKALRLSLDRASGFAIRQVLEASSQGDRDANTIYERLVSNVLSHSPNRRRSRDETKQDLRKALEALSTRAQTFSEYGLIGQPKTDLFADAIRDASPQAFRTLVEIISPYMDGLKARLDALQKIQDRIAAFMSTVNGFYNGKQIVFNAQTGFRIIRGDGKELAPQNLSSGERQLLLLFCNLFIASQQNSIFIVDEPELSLNVKWQRLLVDNLLRFTQDGRIQFVLATHSIELLTRHRSEVLQLVSTDS